MENDKRKNTLENWFEKKKGSILLATSEFEMLSNRDAYFTKYNYHNWLEKWKTLEPIADLFFSLEDIPISYQTEMKALDYYLKLGEEIIKQRNQKKLQDYNKSQKEV